jgi:hypothetical protein
LPAHAGFAGADLAGDEPDAAQLDQVLQACLGFACGAGSEQLIGAGGTACGSEGYEPSGIWATCIFCG